MGRKRKEEADKDWAICSVCGQERKQMLGKMIPHNRENDKGIMVHCKGSNKAPEGE